MFSRGEPTFSFLFKRGQINSSAFSPHSYLLHPRSRHQHNPQVPLPSALQSASLFIQKQTQQLKQIKRKKKRKETPVGLALPTRIPPATGTTLSTSLTFSTPSEGTPAKGRCIDYLLADPK